MTSILFRILLVILILWLLKHFLAKILGAPKSAGTGENIGSVPNNMVKDPVCGMYMDSRLAVRLQNRKDSVYFCSEECRNKYLSGSANESGVQNPPPG